MYKHSVVHHITKFLVDLLFFSGIICCAFVPYFVRLFGAYFSLFPTTGAYYWFYTILLLLCGLAAVYILFNLKCMFRTLLGGNPFVKQNISCFRKMAVACALISVLFFIKCFVMFTIASAIVVTIFTLACLFCLTLKDIFKQAIFYKEENDLTV